MKGQALKVWKHYPRLALSFMNLLTYHFYFQSLPKGHAADGYFTKVVDRKSILPTVGLYISVCNYLQFNTIENTKLKSQVDL